MGKEVGHSPSTVHGIWQAYGLQPHRIKTFKLSSNPFLCGEGARSLSGATRAGCRLQQLRAQAIPLDQERR